MGVHVVRVACDHSTQLVNGFLVLARLEEYPANAGSGDRERVEFAGAPGHGECLLPSSLAEKPPSKSVIGECFIRTQLKCELVLRFRFRPTPFLLFRDCEQDVCVGGIWVQLQGLSRIVHDLCSSLRRGGADKDGAQRLISICQSEIRHCKSRVSVDSLLEIPDALLDALFAAA